MVQTAVNGVTDEDIAKRWPTNPVVDGGTVLGVASRELQALNAVRYQVGDSCNALIDKLREMEADDDVTIGQFSKQENDVLAAVADHKNWDKLFWCMLRFEFGLSSKNVGIASDGRVVQLPQHKELSDEGVLAILADIFGPK